MSSTLKQKIKILEAYIDVVESNNSALLNHPYYLLLKENINKPKIAEMALVGSFVLGYLFSRKQSPVELASKAIKLPFFISTILPKLKFLAAIFG